MGRVGPCGVELPLLLLLLALLVLLVLLVDLVLVFGRVADLPLVAMYIDREDDSELILLIL